MAAADNRNDVVDLERGQFASACWVSASAALPLEHALNVVNGERAARRLSACAISLHVGYCAFAGQLGMPVFPSLNRGWPILRILLFPSLYLRTMASRVFGPALASPASLKARMARHVAAPDVGIAHDAFAGRNLAFANVAVLARLANKVKLLTRRSGGQSFWYRLHAGKYTASTVLMQGVSCL
jgi:hypothetical protein